MLVSLTIRNLVLIDQLTVTLRPGFTVMTGETGAGKSVILNAIELATGMRGGRDLIRNGCDQASVTAVFDFDLDAPLWDRLAEQGIENEDMLVVRRVLSSDGKSRCFINDQPVTLALVRDIAGPLVEIHGQFDAQTITNAGGQRGLLDAYGVESALTAATRQAFDRWQDLKSQLEALEDRVRRDAEDEEFLRHQLAELDDLDAQVDEEERLLEQRGMLMHAERLSEELAATQAAIGAGDGITGELSRSMRRLERLTPIAERTVEPVISAIDRVMIELDELTRAIDEAHGSIDRAPAALEQTESRLSELRDAARKYRVQVDELPGLLERTKEQIGDIEGGTERLDELRRENAAAFTDYAAKAKALSEARVTAAEALAAVICGELPDLKLDKARFRCRVSQCEPEAGGRHGIDNVAFEVSINPGQPFTPLERSASGGERSRILLAMKAALGDSAGFATMIFDEIDTGLGGATADAVGERLNRLAKFCQVIAISHAPQVAARAATHLKVEKTGDDEASTILLGELDDEARRDELARMLAGATITDAARAAADSLLGLVHSE